MQTQQSEEVFPFWDKLDQTPFFEIVDALILDDSSDAEIERAKKCFQWVNQNSKQLTEVCSERPERFLLQKIWAYYHETNCPPTREALGEYLLRQEKTTILLEFLEDYDKLDLRKLSHVELTNSLNKRRRDWREGWLISVLRQTKVIATGALHTDASLRGKEPKLAGVDDAIKTLRRRLLEDVGSDDKPIQGEWLENLDHVEKSLLDVLHQPEQRRILTGFRAIDNSVVIGPTESIRFIGILGYTNHNKSSVLLTMLYNMARSGKRILLVPREFSAEEAWQRLTWQHAEFFPHLNLPSLQQWKLHPETVTSEQQKNMRMLLDDLRSRRTIKGSIEVINASKWEQIVDYLQASEQPYDVLAIDYIGHLETEGRSQDRHEQVKAIFRQAQQLSRDYLQKRGLVVITPLQANKEGVRKVDEQEDEEWGDYQGNLSAVEWYSQAAQDMDLVIGVFQKGILQEQNLIKVSCAKSRNIYFPAHIVKADPRTRYIRDQNTGKQSGHVLPARANGAPRPEDHYMMEALNSL